MEINPPRNEVESTIVGQKIWLEYFDQNSPFERAFVPQYCTVTGRYSDTTGADDWYLVALAPGFEYDGIYYDHLLIRSRWVGCSVGGADPTAVFIVLVPTATGLANPFELNRSLYVAWGFSARNEAEISR